MWDAQHVNTLIWTNWICWHGHCWWGKHSWSWRWCRYMALWCVEDAQYSQTLIWTNRIFWHHYHLWGKHRWNWRWNWWCLFYCRWLTIHLSSCWLAGGQLELKSNLTHQCLKLGGVQVQLSQIHELSLQLVTQHICRMSETYAWD